MKDAPCLWPWTGGPRLISLWDIMKTLDLDKVFQLGCGCQSTATQLNPMKVIWVESTDASLDETLRQAVSRHYSKVLGFCAIFDLPVSQASCLHILELLKDEFTAKGRWLHAPTEALLNSIRVELQSRLFLYVPNQSAAFYREPLAGWQNVQDAFPSAIYDVEEAAKCFGLRRSTASVFHAMRVLERGLGVLAGEFKVPFEHKTWNEVIEQIEAAIRQIKKQKNKPPDWKADEQFYSEAAAQFMHFKNAWRNYTAHGHFKYTEDEAEAIFRHARDFMVHIAKRLKESPTP